LDFNFKSGLATMPSRKLPLIKGMYYHVFNRGFGKETIFYEYNDYKRFVENMVRYKQEFDWINIYAWCLLPNHFHILLKSEKSGEEISSFMRKLQQSYAMYFKIKYKRISPDLKLLQYPQVFEWRFKAKLIDDETYLETVINYIVLNPLKHEIVSRIEDWDFTSYHQMEDKPSPDLLQDIVDELEF